MERIQRDNRVKWYGIVIGIASALLQHGIYLLGHKLADVIGIEPFLPKIPVIDDRIPLTPIFIIPYVWSYLYWAMAPMAASKCRKEHFADYLAAYLFACLAGMLILAFAPTYMDRVAEGLYLPRSGFFARLMRFWYSLDGSEMAYNLFPSFHCLNSTVSYLAVAGRKEVPRWYRVYSLILTILIYASTVLVKQHYVADIFGGIAVAVIAFVLCKRLHAGRIFLKAVSRFGHAGAKGEKQGAAAGK